MAARAFNAANTVRCSCGSQFKSEDSLQQHKEDSPRHNEVLYAVQPTSYPCSCGKHFKDVNALRNHKRDSPSHQKDVVIEASYQPKCSCGKAFKTEQGLRQHHIDSPRHQGDIIEPQTDGVKCSCGRSFRTQDDWEMHKSKSPMHREDRAKNGQDTATCSCGKTFKDLEALQQHQRDSILHKDIIQPYNDPFIHDGRVLECASPSNARLLSSSSNLRPSERFTTAGQEDSAPFRSKQKGKQTPRYSANREHRGVYSSSSTWYPDIGDNHGLCDKDCGWCGHCAEEAGF